MYRFDDFVIEPSTFRLLKGGVPVRIEPKALELLIYLAQHPERVLSKRELLDAIWKGTAVTENALTRAIAHIRKVLDDDAEAPRYVETVPTKGYRFVAELGEKPAAPPAPSPPPPASPPPPRVTRGTSRLPWVLGILTVTATIATVLIVAISAVRYLARAPEMPGKVLKPPKSEAPQLTGRPLHPDSRLQTFPAFAPDRNEIAYAADTGAGPQIFVSNLISGEERQVTNVPDGATQLSWSPDAKSIAYTSPRRGGIWIVDAGGGTPRQLTKMGSRPAWSPDGSDIAFQTGDLIELGWTGFDALPPSEIQLVNVVTKKVTPLTRSGTPGGGHGAPAWRPDGARLAFTSCDLEHCAIYVIGRDGSGRTPVWSDPRRASSPVFSPDGRTLYFVAGFYNRSILLRQDIDPSGHPQGMAVRLRATGPGVMQHLAISPDGKQLAWSVIEETSELMAVDAKGGGAPQQITRNAIARTMDPAFSPDGTRLAYCAAGAGDDSGVWVANADGTRARGLAVGPGLKQHAQWLPDGFTIAFAAWRDAPTVFEASLVKGTVASRAVLPKRSEAPALSPDGKEIAFTFTEAAGTSIRIGDRRLTDPLLLARYPMWSPRGKSISAQVRRDRGVGIIAPEGGSVRVIPWDGEIWPHGWSPDEKEIAFAGRRGGVWNIWAMPVAGGSARQITQNESTMTVMRTPIWSPNGATIVYESGTPRGNVWISVR